MSLPELEMPQHVILANKIFVTLVWLYGFAPAKTGALKRIVKLQALTPARPCAPVSNRRIPSG
jgi:hypothetical protein